MRSGLRVFAGAVLPLLVTGAGWGQQGAPAPAEGAYTLHVDTRIVVLDVVVHDKSGANVKHLTKDDFTVYEDKVPQTIKSFEEVSQPAPAAVVAVHSTAELDKLEPNAPVSILVLDELTTKFEDLAFARYSLQKYLAAQGDTLSQPTMLIAANYTNVAVLRDYTTSRKEILDALDHHMASINSMMRANSPSWAESQFKQVFGSLVNVAQATAGHPGHKNMIWIGRGFPTVDPETLTTEDQESLDKTIASCSNLLRDARVTLYSIDPAGLTVAVPAQDADGFPLESPFGGQVDFDTMVEATGGQALHGRNDVDGLIAESVRDGESFYTISYRPSAGGDQTKEFRNIHVVMKDRSLTASTREGYFTKADAIDPARDAKGKLSDRLVFDVDSAAASLLVYDGIPLSVARDGVATDHFVLHMHGSSLLAKDDGLKGSNVQLTVVLESFNRRGKVLQRNAHLVTVRLAAPGSTPASDETVDLPETISTDPPVARVRFVVRDNASGKIGAENFFLVDPKTLNDPATGVDNKHAYR